MSRTVSILIIDQLLYYQPKMSKEIYAGWVNDRNYLHIYNIYNTWNLVLMYIFTNLQTNVLYNYNW